MTTASERAQKWLNDFDAALKSGSPSNVAPLFDEDCYWRDLVSFTWNIKTMEGKSQIADMLEATLKHVKPHDWKLAEDATRLARLASAVSGTSRLEDPLPLAVMLRGSGYGYLR